ncbi:MAG: sugar-binding protein [Armatimonadota bacterium]
MKQGVFLVTLLLLSALALAAAEFTAPPAQYMILPPKTPITIDGKLGEWDMARTPYQITAHGKNPLNTIHVGAKYPVKSDADLSGRAALAWDATYLYVAGQMVDDHLVGVRPDSLGNQGPAGWFVDSLMVRVASFRQPLKTNTPYNAFPFLALRYAPTGPNSRGSLLANDRNILDTRDFYWKLTEHAKWAVTETPNGYAVEAAIPWKDLDFTPRVGERLFIGFLAADTDPGEELKQVGWGFADDTKGMPQFRLADGKGTLGLLTVSQDEVPADQAWAVRVEIDALQQPVKLEAIRVVDAQGNSVLQHPVGVLIPQGKRGADLREFTAGAVAKPGSYRVEALAAPANGAAVVVAQIPVRIVAAKIAPPVIQNAPGELRHMPADRVAHNAYLEHREGFYRHGFVKSKDDYVPFIRKHIEPTLKSDAQTVLKTKPVWGARTAIRCMALYRITGDEEYLRLTRDIMDNYLTQYATWRSQGELVWKKLTPLTMYRYLTWGQDPASPFAPKDAEKRYRQIMINIAADPADDLFAEYGTHNRVWQRYSVMKLARLIAEAEGKPVSKRLIDFTDYNDKVLGEIGDSDDATPGYHWVFMDAAFAIYFGTGDWKGFLANRGFRKSFDRYVEMVGVNGACPQFASCSGWHEVGMSMWAYEWMSRITKDGRYRWASQRIAEYYYNHLDHRTEQYHMVYDTALDNFCRAYLLADDSVPPQAPPAASRVTWRHPTIPTPLEQMKARPGTSARMMDSTKWIPDKVVLSSGNDAQSLWGLVELLPYAGHGGELPGSIIALIQHDAALLAGQGYYEFTPEYQNIMWIEDLDGVASDPRPMTTDVPVYVDDPAYTFVRIVTTAYQHLPVIYTRDLFFYKNGFLVVKDRVKFEATMKARLGPCYQTRVLGPECGEHWFNTYYDQLYYTGLGLGRGVQAYQNPNWDLLVYFSPRNGRKHTVVDRYQENPYRCSPTQLRQSWSGLAQAGQEITFTAVLLPHSPVFNPKSLLQPPADGKEPVRLEVIRDDDKVTVVKAITQPDPTHAFLYETWVMLNETGGAIKAGPLESDGQVAVVGFNYSGKIAQRGVAGGALLRFRDADESAQARKAPAAPLKRPAEFTDMPAK